MAELNIEGTQVTLLCAQEMIDHWYVYMYNCITIHVHKHILVQQFRKVKKVEVFIEKVLVG